MTDRVNPFEELAEFTPKAPAEKRQVPVQKAVIEKIAKDHNFPSRQPPKTDVPVPRAKRRFKTGRNVQINIKGSHQSKARLYRLADQFDLTLGEFLERAMDAIEQAQTKSQASAQQNSG